mmetsp:Transcript_989/g.1919  ORF Transcript_989/g.1919 Transcript_989/m.1919 type:complete len:90 (+) Transcript_989:89-358(+)|eukprot:CAMPEP_0113627732 /NCGR_PEP_ID=MMETSP0017_2-20120614/14364_1 /TAXON_ID=2856 /ORGANISM="Cylindrotheca closterium" /LENGTH=89 /DNA_ID=CAMNT_0000538001 /DNA_START=89 /DNA_END=358 /DNA_ORIENTATION=- /assembly_acc=CAM_ASM_000147
MKVFKKTKSNSKLQDEQAAAQQKEPLTPQKSEDSEDSSQDDVDEMMEGEEEEEVGAMDKILNSIAGICGGGSANTNDEWCNMKEGMAEI